MSNFEESSNENLKNKKDEQTLTNSKNINTIGNVSNDSMWANINYIYLSGLGISALANLYST